MEQAHWAVGHQLLGFKGLLDEFLEMDRDWPRAGECREVLGERKLVWRGRNCRSLLEDELPP